MAKQVNTDADFQGDTFGRILKYVQRHTRHSRLKESKDKLIVIFDQVSTVEKAKAIFDELLNA